MTALTAKIDRYFVLVGLVFAGAGLLLGDHMGRTHNHGQMPTHAHIMLAGFVFSFIYGALYRMWPALKAGWLPLVQFVLHVIGALALVVALFFLYGGMAEETQVLPLLIIGPTGIILAWLVFIVWFAMKGTDAKLA